MKRFLVSLGSAILVMLKWFLWIVLNTLKLVLEITKIFLLLLALVGRVFLSFVRIGTS